MLPALGSLATISVVAVAAVAYTIYDVRLIGPLMIAPGFFRGSR